MPGRADAPALLGGTGKDQVHLLVVATGERGLAGGFNSSIARLAREHAARLLERGQDGQDPDRRPQGQRHPQAQLSPTRSSRRSSSAKCGSSATSTPRGRREDPRDVRGRRVRRRDAVLCDLQVGDQPGPDGAAADPGQVRAGRAGGDAERHLRIRAGRGSDPRRPAAAQHLGAGVPRAAREQRVVLRRADERHGQRHAQRRRHDQQADAASTTASARRRSPKNSSKSFRARKRSRAGPHGHAPHRCGEPRRTR